MSYSRRHVFVIVWLVLFVCLHIFLKVQQHEAKPKSPFELGTANESADTAPLTILSEEAVSSQIEDYPLTVFTFWETWCEPCASEMPLLNTIYESHPEVQVIGIFHSSPSEEVKDFIKKYDIHFPLMKDQNKTFHKKYKVQGYPTLVIIDSEQNILHEAQGFQSEKETLDPIYALILKTSEKSL